MSRKLDQIRNIGVIAHIDAGKTTVTERMLFNSGSTHRIGEVDKGTTETDFDEEEQQRGITIYSACVTFQWKDVIFNLIDTPGHVDFTAEVERCLRVLDGGVVVFSAREGVEAQSETVWHQADKYQVPRIAFINKMDREGADFESTLKEIEQRLNANPVAVQIPVGQGPPHVENAFCAVIDLISMKMFRFSPGCGDEGVVREEIPQELQVESDSWRELMLEKLYDYSNELMELALQEESVPVKLVKSVLREATLHQQIQPVLCGSALDGIGIQPLLDAAADYLPSPADMPPVKGSNPKKNIVEKRKPNSSEPFCGLVFKIVADRHGDMSWLRVYSGQLKANSRIYNTGKDKKENAAQLWHIHASRREQVELVEAGDIIGLIGLRHSVTGDTLCSTKNPLLLESIDFPDTVISMAIEPESTAERKKLSSTLEMMKRQDPTFSAIESEDTGQTIISGMGELHLEVIKHKLLRDFNLNVKVHKPRVSYRETIDQRVEVVGECRRQIGGQQLFAKLRICLEPKHGSKEPIEVLDQTSPGSFPESFISVVLDELKACGQGGGLIGGFPLTKMNIVLLGGEYEEDSLDEVAFRIAAADGFEKGLKQGEPVLLEPVMKLSIVTPEEYLGEFVSDLQQRRSIITKTENRGNNAIIEAQAPLSELFGYSSAMRSLSQGRASSSMEPMEYSPAPKEVVQGFQM